jgi:hypothetical protein
MRLNPDYRSSRHHDQQRGNQRGVRKPPRQ